MSKTVALRHISETETGWGRVDRRQVGKGRDEN